MKFGGLATASLILLLYVYPRGPFAVYKIREKWTISIVHLRGTHVESRQIQNTVFVLLFGAHLYFV